MHDSPDGASQAEDTEDTRSEPLLLILIIIIILIIITAASSDLQQTFCSNASSRKQFDLDQLVYCSEECSRSDIHGPLRMNQLFV